MRYQKKILQNLLKKLVLESKILHLKLVNILNCALMVLSKFIVIVIII